jgi:hypothetical protein
MGRPTPDESGAPPVAIGFSTCHSSSLERPSQLCIATARQRSSNAGPANPYGWTDSPLGALRMTRNAPHRGGLHPGGDEATSGEEDVEALHPGEAIVVPKGVRHRVDIREPCHLVHITRGRAADTATLTTVASRTSAKNRMPRPGSRRTKNGTRG